MKKGQAAMEFLMTYGWAILVVLAAIGALAYFGVLSPDRFLPSKCVINPPFSCGEFKVATDGSITVGITNNAGVSLSSVTARFTTSDCTLTTTGADAGSGTVASAENMTFTSIDNGRKLGGQNLVWHCDSALTSGDKFQGSFEITYTKSGESLSHTTTGSLQTKVE